MKGWVEKGQEVRPWTELSRAFERATGEPPFKIPERWMAAKDRLDMSTRANFTTNNDIVGGNSGSPMLNAKGEIVGLAFDGNIHSISGSYWFDERMNRSIGVHPAYIRTALEKVYGAKDAARGNRPATEPPADRSKRNSARCLAAAGAFFVRRRSALRAGRRSP